MKILKIRFVDGYQTTFWNVIDFKENDEIIRFKFDDPKNGATEIAICKRNIIFVIEMKGEE